METLDVQINLRVTPTEATILDDICARWNCTRSEAIRILLRGPGTADVRSRGRRDKMVQPNVVLAR